ncbi:MAG: hypothetical protein AAGB31_02265 [Bdellovibrio sp.]
MDLLLGTFTLLIMALALAFFSNQWRRQHQRQDFPLHPNCLLTRWPLVFVTGPRSLFYFRAYWNLYTPYLAEHGYEVFIVHLPWNKMEARQQQWRLFLKEQEAQKKPFHLFIDHESHHDLAAFIPAPSADLVLSITEVTDEDEVEDPAIPETAIRAYEILKCPPPTKTASFFLDFSYRLHKWMIRRTHPTSLSALGGEPTTALNNSRLLLERCRRLAEEDVQRP